jgi:hypothetical protein
MITSVVWEHLRHDKDLRQEPKVRTCNVITAQNAPEFPVIDAAGPSFRRQIAGPETELVEEYVESRLPPPPRGQLRTVFVEPEIESGYPDVVAVYWHQATAKNWSRARAKLTKVDVRIAHFLAMVGASGIDDIRPFFSRNLSTSLERLHGADVVRGTSKTWRLRPLLDVFAVRRLVAIEAKVDQWRRGLVQAVQNTWFASESYLLLPHVPAGSRLLEQALRLGVGVRTRDQKLDGPDWLARRDRIPKSYASWLFNEWAWRVALRE